MYSGCSTASDIFGSYCSCSAVTTTQSYACINPNGSTSETGTLTIVHHGSYSISADGCTGARTTKEDPKDFDVSKYFGSESIEERDFEPAPTIPSDGIKK